MNRNIYSSGSKSAFDRRAYPGGRSVLGMASAPRDRRAAEDMTKSMRLAMAYVPYQRFENLYSPSDALDNGTLFGDLNFPYCTGGGR